METLFAPTEHTSAAVTPLLIVNDLLAPMVEPVRATVMIAASRAELRALGLWFSPLPIELWHGSLLVGDFHLGITMVDLSQLIVASDLHATLQAAQHVFFLHSDDLSDLLRFQHRIVEACVSPSILLSKTTVISHATPAELEAQLSTVGLPAPKYVADRNSLELDQQLSASLRTSLYRG